MQRLCAYGKEPPGLLADPLPAEAASPCFARNHTRKLASFLGVSESRRCHESRRGRTTVETLSLPLWRLCNSGRALVHLRPFLLNNNKNTGEGAAEQRNGFSSSSEHRTSRWSDASERSISPRLIPRMSNRFTLIHTPENGGGRVGKKKKRVTESGQRRVGDLERC